MKTETYVCQACGIDVVRPVARGQRPRWCESCRSGARVKVINCEHCGVEARTWRLGRFCSKSCAAAKGNKRRAKPQPAKPARTDLRGALRQGYEDNDPDLFFAALVARADTSGDCWVWPSLRDGYPYFRVAGKDAALHRAVLEVKHGAPLGTQHAHHICANAACVNPDHLQPVTHRDNIAEMLARQSYLARIRELEGALAQMDPKHPLLTVIAVA